MVVSLPATTGQLTGSQLEGDEQVSKFECSDGGVGGVLRVNGDGGEGRGMQEGWGRGEGGGKRGDERGLLERMMESFTATCCLEIRLDTCMQNEQPSQEKKPLKGIFSVCV